MPTVAFVIFVHRSRTQTAAYGRFHQLTIPSSPILIGRIDTMRRLGSTAKALTKMRVDVFVVGDEEGYVVAPSDSWLPLDEMKALGALRFGWTIDTAMAMPKLDWHAVATDIDARGYSIVAADDVGGLLARPQQSVYAIYPEQHRPMAA